MFNRSGSKYCNKNNKTQQNPRYFAFTVSKIYANDRHFYFLPPDACWVNNYAKA